MSIDALLAARDARRTGDRCNAVQRTSRVATAATGSLQAAQFGSADSTGSSRLTRHRGHRVTFLFPNKAAKAAAPSGREHRGHVMAITLKANQAKIIHNILGTVSPSTSNHGFAVKFSGQWRMQMPKICNAAYARAKVSAKFRKRRLINSRIVMPPHPIGCVVTEFYSLQHNLFRPACGAFDRLAAPRGHAE
jgi:hypothetical protein